MTMVGTRMKFTIVTLCLIFTPFLSGLPENANFKYIYKRQPDETEKRHYPQDTEDQDKVSLFQGRPIKVNSLDQSRFQLSSTQSSPYETVYENHSSSTPIPILKFDKIQSLDGSYKASYETGNNIIAEETGYIKNIGVKDQEALVQQGSYTYTAPDGTIITTSYIADEGGFKVEGSHLPTPPPIPEEIRKALEMIFEGIKQQQEMEEHESKYGKNELGPPQSNSDSISNNYLSFDN